MNLIKKWSALPIALGLMMFLYGCQVKPPGDRTIVKLVGGKYAHDQMDNWVAVQETVPTKQTAPDGMVYHRVATHNIVPTALHGQIAINPKLFRKLSGIELKPLNTPAGDLPVIRKKKKIPKELDGWTGVKPIYPTIESDKAGSGAQLLQDMLIPKEMDGWVAMDRETLAKLAGKLEKSKVTIPDPDPKKIERVKKETPKAEGSKKEGSKKEK